MSSWNYHWVVSFFQKKVIEQSWRGPYKSLIKLLTISKVDCFSHQKCQKPKKLQSLKFKPTFHWFALTLFEVNWHSLDNRWTGPVGKSDFLHIKSFSDSVEEYTKNNRHTLFDQLLNKNNILTFSSKSSGTKGPGVYIF